MVETEFSRLARNTLSDICEQIEDTEISEEVEIDFSGDILNIETPRGIYVINKHTAAREIWLASPISGPAHFSYKNDSWVSKKGDNLMHILGLELKTYCNGLKLT